MFRNRLDREFIESYDPASGKAPRVVLEDQGIFVNYVNHATFQYGGGEVNVEGARNIYNPVHMIEARPTVTFNTFTRNADAAISGDANSFADTRMENWDATSPYTADYERIGPLVRGNTVTNNSINGMFVRIDTPPGKPTMEQEVAARWDDFDIVHVVAQNLTLSGNPGGPVQKVRTNWLTLIDGFHLGAVAGGSISDGDYFSLSDGRNEVTFEFDRAPDVIPGYGVVAGRERIEFDPADTAATVANSVAAVIHSMYLAGRLQIDAEIEAGQPTVVKLKLYGSQLRTEGFAELDARPSARLLIDPGMIVKLGGTRIDVEMGAQLIAEGRAGFEQTAPASKVVFTSVLDNRFGAGGTFNTSENTSGQKPAAGDWSGIYFAPASKGSLDHAVIAYAGGRSLVEGEFHYFDPIEIRQAQVRIANSRLEYNAAAVPSGGDRRGWGPRDSAATIFVRGAQPVIVDNDFVDNNGAVISIDVNSLNGALHRLGSQHRLRGHVHRLLRQSRCAGAEEPDDADRELQDQCHAQVSGMEVRGGSLTTEGVWDDTDIVHVLRNEVVVPNFHHVGGLRLQSSATESLVIKLFGANAGFTAAGRPLEIDDRIGGSLQVVGMPGKPVIMTSLRDDSASASTDLLDQPQFDTNGDGVIPGAARAGDWRSIELKRYSNDRNVAVINEFEGAYGGTTDVNSTVTGANAWARLRPPIRPATTICGWGSRSGAVSATTILAMRTFTASTPTPAPRSGSTSTEPRDRWIRLWS